MECFKKAVLVAVILDANAIYNTKEYVVNSIVGSSRRGWLTLSATSQEIDCKPRISSKKSHKPATFIVIKNFLISRLSFETFLRLSRVIRWPPFWILENVLHITPNLTVVTRFFHVDQIEDMNMNVPH